MEEVGFKEVEWLGMTGFRTSQYTVGALFRANKTKLGYKSPELHEKSLGET